MDKLKSFTIVGSGMMAKVSMARINGNLTRAQYWLDSQIMTDMVPYMPHYTGSYVNLTRAQSAAIAGSGMVVAGAGPMGRFLYNGKVMVDPVTNSPWARKGAKKVVTERPLTYSNPKARPKWFEVAKKENASKWISGVKKEMKK